MNPEHGGPAFPRSAFDTNGCHNEAQEGMFLIDYFAGQALTGYLAIFADPGEIVPPSDVAAKAAYDFAQAMIAERAKRMS